MGVSIGNIKPSITIIYNSDLYIVLECEHAKVARGSAFCRVKLKNLKTAQTRDTTLRDSDNIEIAFIEKRKLQYTYNDGNFYHFSDLENYDDLILPKSRIEDNIIWLKDNLEFTGLFYNSELMCLEFPLAIKLKVIETEPGFRGNTVKGGNKPAKLETGLIIQVPLFINTADIIKVDTRTKEYLERV